MKPSKSRRALSVCFISLLLLQACREPTTGPVLTLGIDESFGYSDFNEEVSVLFQQHNLFWEFGRSLGSGGSAEKVVFYTEVQGENLDYALFKTPVPPIDIKGGEVVALLVSDGFFNLPPTLLARVHLLPDDESRRGFLIKRLENVLGTGNPSVLPGSIPLDFRDQIAAKSIQKMAILDLLLNQADRHLGNMLLVPEGDNYRVITIDNEVVLRVATPLPQLLLSNTPEPGNCKTSLIRVNCKFTPIWVNDEILNPFIKTRIDSEITSFLSGLDIAKVVNVLRNNGAKDEQLFLFRACATVVKKWSASGKTIEDIYNYFVDPNGLTGALRITAAQLKAFLEKEFPEQVPEQVVSSRVDFATSRFFEYFAANSQP